MAIHRAVGISRQRNSGYRPSRINIMAQGLSIPDPSLSPKKERSHNNYTLHTHHKVSLMVSCNTTLVLSLSSLGLHIRPACEAGLSVGMRRERVSPQIRRKKEKLWLRIQPISIIGERGCNAFTSLTCKGFRDRGE